MRDRPPDSRYIPARMFTGLIEDVGEVAAVEHVVKGARIVVDTRLADLTHGASVAVDGVCLTAVDLAHGQFTADVSAETLERSTLGGLRAGDKVNLERPVSLATRLGGHLVLGHVDGVGEITDYMPIGARREDHGYHGLIRRLKVVRGMMPFRMECFPAFNYGRDAADQRAFPAHDGRAAQPGERRARQRGPCLLGQVQRERHALGRRQREAAMDAAGGQGCLPGVSDWRRLRDIASRARAGGTS